MDERLNPIIQRSVLEIINYGYHIRTEMEQLNRKMPFYVMSYLKSGEALLRIFGKDYLIKAGDAILIPPNVVHDHIKTSKEDAIFLWWHFNFRPTWNIDVLALFRFPVLVYMKNAVDFEKKFIEYLDAIKNEKTISDIIFRNAKALEVLASIMDSFVQSEKTKVTPEVPAVFLNILNEVSNAQTSSLSLSVLSEKYHMNPTYISNKFKEYFGISPIFLHREMLVDKAKEYLRSSTRNVNEISEELGFTEHAIFTRFFTDKVGVSPTKFRNDY